MFERPKDPVEILKEELSALVRERKPLKEKIIESKENIYVRLGSDEYKDFGYSARLEEIDKRIKEIEEELQEADDIRASQRRLNL